MSYRREQRERDKLDPRGPEMAELYRSKWTRGAIAALYGLSTERVKDLLVVHMPAEERWSIYRAECAAEAAERKSQALLAELLRRCASAKPCVVCGAWVLRRSPLTCSRKCAAAWYTGRHQLSEDANEKHRIAQARTYLANPDRYEASRIEWAKRMLSDDPPPPNRRFVVPGSRAAAVLESLDR